MRKARSLLIAAVVGAAATSAGEASAQVCIGYPIAGGQATAALTANFPTGGTDFGAEAAYHTTSGFAVFGGANLRDREVGGDITSFGGGASFTLPELRASLPVGLLACPVVSVAVATADEMEDVVSVPVGMGFGTIIPLGETMSLSPHATPQLRWNFVGDDSTADWVLTAGANLLGFLGQRVYAGVIVNRVFIEGAESVLGFRVGLVF